MAELLHRSDPTHPVPPGARSVLTLNGGSSSIRFSVYALGADAPSHEGRIERIGLPPSRHSARPKASPLAGGTERVTSRDREPTAFLVRWLREQPFFGSVAAIGHRVVQGMTHARPERVTGRLLRQLRQMKVYDPDHLPRELDLIEAFRRPLPRLPQVVCFDTAFHHRMPRVATLLSLPRRFASHGMRRYGFHGLSYTFLMEELARLKERSARRGRVVLAHLGNGASMAAVLDGVGIDTSMGFTPAAGLVMSTRSGDLDPGIVAFLSRTEGMTAAQFDRMVNHQSGLLGVSGTSSDMRDLCEAQEKDPRAAEAIALFCYQASKWIGAFAAVLGGIDLLVFAGGIGEHSPEIRARICRQLGFLGIVLDPVSNRANAPVISAARARTRVRVIPTNEESVIVRATAALLSLR